jgi:DEAD/DEAH box helicase domain-containing protein
MDPRPSTIDALLEEIRRTFREEVVHYRYLRPEDARYSEPERPLRTEVQELLRAEGIERLFIHQARGIDLIREGHNIVVMTPTASGKSLIYNIPVLESILDDPSTKALYLFPLKGLEQDQIKRLRGYAERLGITNPAEIYDGDTTSYRRKRIRDSLPNIIFSNPDMLHLAINAFHTKWMDFFRNLRFVIIDEIHTYRGAFGSHVAHVLRRLRRICHHYGSRPQFIACSATIANPEGLARDLTGLDFAVVDRNGAPRGGRHIIFLNPYGSPYTTATKVFRLCIDQGLKSIAFTKARRITELMYSWLVDASPEYRHSVSSYRAGFLPSERREIEQRLFSGELKGVISTSALELGVDIGGLDACILTGYPGSIASTWQRAGRVGRHGQDALIVMVALRDALDQYFMRHPEDFFSRGHEAVVVDSSNRSIIRQHLPCASAEVYLRVDDPVYDVQEIMPVIDELSGEGRLRPGRNNDIWFSPRRYPQREVSIRGIGAVYGVYCDDRRIAEISGTRVFKEAHPGAIYLHKGRQYRVERLDLEALKIYCKEVDVHYYTQAITHEETEVLAEKETIGAVSWGGLRITSVVTGYWRKRLLSQDRLERHRLDLPPWRFESQGLWMRFDDTLEERLLSRGHDLAGGLHALEHAMISVLPLFAMCDKGDIGGRSYTIYPEFMSPAIFIYDGYEGGIGLTRRGFDVIEGWIDATERLIRECPCELGCPSCVYDSQCGSGNEPLDKGAALLIIQEARGLLKAKTSTLT